MVDNHAYPIFPWPIMFDSAAILLGGIACYSLKGLEG